MSIRAALTALVCYFVFPVKGSKLLTIVNSTCYLALENDIHI